MEILIIIFVAVIAGIWFYISDILYRRSLTINQLDIENSKTLEKEGANKIQQKKICVFCGGSPLSKEHLWPDWIKGIVPRSGIPKHVVTFTETEGHKSKKLISKDERKIFQGYMGNKQLKIVCEKCNNGWMSKIETESKEVLTSLILNKPITLRQEQMGLLVKWIILRNIIGEYTDKIENRAIRATERHRFAKRKSSTSEWKIWIAKINAPNWKFRFIQDGIFFGSLEKHSIIPYKEPLKNTMFSIISIENFLAFTAYTSIEGLSANFKFESNLANKLFEIHPDSRQMVDWSQVAPLSNQDVNELKDYLINKEYKILGDH